MSNQIPTAFVEGYKSNIYHLSQQMEARLFPKARQEQQASETDFYERIGAVDAQEIVGRHGDTPILDTPHSRRAVDLRDAEYGDLIDKMDRVRLLINPDDAYVKAAVNSMNRFKDDIFIEAALGNARSGKGGGTLVPLPNSQKVSPYDGATTTGLNLNVNALRASKRILDENETDNMGGRRYFACTASQMQSLLEETEVTSSDFNTVRALVNGELNTFVGFEFIRSERLPRAAAATTYDINDGSVGAGTGTVAAAQSRRCIAWVDDGMISAKGLDIFVRLSERDDKRYSTQVYVAQSVGAVRMEEEKVVEVICAEV